MARSQPTRQAFLSSICKHPQGGRDRGRPQIPRPGGPICLPGIHRSHTRHLPSTSTESSLAGELGGLSRLRRRPGLLHSHKAGKGHGCAAGSLSDPGDTVHAERRLLKAEGPDRRKQCCSWTGDRPRPAPALPGGIQQPSAQEAPLGGQRFDAGEVEEAGWCCAGEEACRP